MHYHSTVAGLLLLLTTVIIIPSYGRASWDIRTDTGGENNTLLGSDITLSGETTFW